jgi:hypothetical protein
MHQSWWSKFVSVLEDGTSLIVLLSEDLKLRLRA